MESVTQVSQNLQQVLETEANRLARETGWQQRQRKLSGADFVQTLIFGWFQERFHPKGGAEKKARLGSVVGYPKA